MELKYFLLFTFFLIWNFENILPETVSNKDIKISVSLRKVKHNQYTVFTKVYNKNGIKLNYRIALEEYTKIQDSLSKDSKYIWIETIDNLYLRYQETIIDTSKYFKVGLENQNKTYIPTVKLFKNYSKNKIIQDKFNIFTNGGIKYRLALYFQDTSNNVDKIYSNEFYIN